MHAETSSSSKPDEDFELAKWLQEGANRIYDEMNQREGQANTDQRLVLVGNATTNPNETIIRTWTHEELWSLC